MGKDTFITGLKELGYVVKEPGDNRVIIDYPIKDGRFNGQLVQVGFEVPGDFEATPPSGPHISPRLLPINSGGNHTERANESPNFGPDWEYLSRPYPPNTWPKTHRTVRVYMMHIKRLLETL